MLTVGIPEGVDRDLHSLLPAGIALEIIPKQPQRVCEVEFWIAPIFKKHAQQAWPFLCGVRVVQSMLAGVDNLRPLLPPDVILCDARGVHAIAAAEWAVAAILASLKYFPLFVEIQRSGIWKRRFEAQEQYAAFHPAAPRPHPAVLVEELHGKRVLIVGYGSIGQAIEERLRPFGVRIDRIARTAREGVGAIASLPELLPAADILILSVPLTSETTGLIGAPELASMKQGALLVNVARGPVVDTDALLATLRSGRIRAAFDVTDPEPLPDAHSLWSAPNLFLTPHIAGSTPMFMRRAMELAAVQIGRYLRGEPLENIVTGEY